MLQEFRVKTAMQGFYKHEPPSEKAPVEALPKMKFKTLRTPQYRLSLKRDLKSLKKKHMGV